MILTLFKMLCVVLVLLGPTLLAARRFGMARAFGALGVSLILSGLAGLMTVIVDSLYLKLGLGLALLVWSAWIHFAPNHWSSFMEYLFGNSVTSGLVVLLLSTVAPFGNLEWLALLTTNMGLVQYYTPLQTQQMTGVEDWREYHVVSDTLREQDPVLFWRSIRGTPPFSSQGFKTSIEMKVPKPKNVFRIMAYGDSNTEGTLTMDWPNEIFQILQSRNTPERIYEVINAGVAGYSSYQGLQRFLQEWKTYEPDLILVSFGWNDLPMAIDQPDKAYRPKTAIMANVLRTLMPYRSYMAIQHYMVSDGLQYKKGKAEARVPLDDYLKNMKHFRDVGYTHGIPVVFLTRAYQTTTSKLLMEPNWSSKVPSYNEALLTFAQTHGEHIIDVQKHFEFETEGLFSDACHFTQEGRVEMARFLIRELDLRSLL